MRAAKVQASLRIRAVSPEPSLLAHTSSESRGTFRQKARSLAPLNGWACAVKICHDGMLEDTNSLGGAHLQYLSAIIPCNVLVPQSVYTVFLFQQKARIFFHSVKTSTEYIFLRRNKSKFCFVCVHILEFNKVFFFLKERLDQSIKKITAYIIVTPGSQQSITWCYNFILYGVFDF